MISTVLRAIGVTYSRHARQRRSKIFLQALCPTPGDKILDLGSYDGSHIASVLPFRASVTIADIDQHALERGRALFGFRPISLDECGSLPFQDRSFDIVFCSSVIEHVTVDKRQVWHFQSSSAFATAASARQRHFAREIRRVAKRYFVQTPNRYFPIESHTWLPVLIVILPRRLQLGLIAFFNRWWPKKTLPDWHLLTEDDMRALFPDAEIAVERSFGFVKSIMAINR